MSYPSDPSRDYSFTAFAQVLGDDSFPGLELDVQLDKLISSIIEVNSFLASSFRTDGNLRNGSVTRDQLGADIQLGFNSPTVWVTGTSYTEKDSVFDNNKMYLATAAHVAGPSFAADLAADLWSLLVDFEIPAATAQVYVDQAEAARDLAQAAALSADQDATDAANSVAAISGFATDAGNSASAAATSATNAANSATAAGSSATSAGNSATAAAGSASDAAASASAAASSEVDAKTAKTAAEAAAALASATVSSVSAKADANEAAIAALGVAQFAEVEFADWANGVWYSGAHGLASAPKAVWLFAECTVDLAPYTVGQRVPLGMQDRANNDGSGTNFGAGIAADSTSVTWRMGAQGARLMSSSGSTMALSDANFKIVAVVVG